MTWLQLAATPLIREVDDDEPSLIVSDGGGGSDVFGRTEL
jgi:hypothetical protein